MMESQGPVTKPPWIRVRMPHGESFRQVREMMRGKALHTVCEEARCPNMAECWGCGTATFLILGDVCTRNCRFCAVGAGAPGGWVDFGEAARVADAVAIMALKHVVITSVTRDDLEDGGAGMFAETVREVHARVPGCTIEVLIPDFQGHKRAIEKVIDARPNIVGHNVETVPRLYSAVRPQAVYRRSLEVLRMVKDMEPAILTKSGLMVGLGEYRDEVLDVAADLRQAGCDILTVGQYLRPTKSHLPVLCYYSPEEFEDIKNCCLAAGFKWVESGPLVRSSYHADRQVGIAE